jgi:serine/threonine protein phosphatase PrpC
MSDVQVSVSARTDVGMHRSGNEDSFLIADLTSGAGLDGEMSAHSVGERGSLLIVSDGMGGAAAGEIASQMAVTTIHELFMEKPLGMDASEHLRKAAEEANDRIWTLSQEKQELAGMGATLTAVLVHGTSAYIAQVGDSRAYLIRNRLTKQLTRDQSLAQMLVDAGAIQPDQVGSVPQNVIMQALGTQPNVRVVMTTIQLYRNDLMLLCSDGLSNKIDSDEMQDIIESSDDLAAASSRMIEIANQRGGEDNITVIIARFDGEALRAISESIVYSDNTSTMKQIDVAEEPTEITARLTSPPLPETDCRAAAVAAGSQAAAQEITDPLASMPFAPSGMAEIEERPRATAHIPRKRSYTPIIIYAVLALLLIGFAAYFAYRYFQKPEQLQITPPQEQTSPPPAQPQDQTQAPQQDTQQTPQVQPAPQQDQPQTTPQDNTNQPSTPTAPSGQPPGN